MKKLLGAAAPGFVYFVPLFALAQQVQSGEIETYLNGVITFINNVIIPAIFAIAFLVFIWGIFKYFIVGADDEEARGKGKQLMIWGIIGFILIAGIVGIIDLIVDATGLSGQNADIKTPMIPKIGS